MYFVYELVDPCTNSPRYVGITNNPNQRLQEHINRLDGSNTAKETWIQKLQEEHLSPSMKIIEIVQTKKEALNREKYYIEYYTQKEIELTNIAGMDVKGPGEGYYTEVEVRKMLNIDRNVFAVFVGIGLITRDRPNCYLKGEIDKLSAKLKVFRGRYGVEALTRLRSIPIPRKSN